MIHQLIFANPKPGMSEPDFHHYWLYEHATKYASKIPQIRRYLIDTRIPFGPGDDKPLFSGVAEIWLENEQEQLASLQSPEFLQGARLDEPRWAAFWQTLVLDTTANTIVTGDPPARDDRGVKLLILLKRRPGLSLPQFRDHLLKGHRRRAEKIPGLRRYWQCHTRDSSYVVGEARFDCVLQLWFDDEHAAQRAMAWLFQQEITDPDLVPWIDPQYLFPLLVREHWIIGPASRGPKALDSDGDAHMNDPQPDSTRAVALRWFKALAGGDVKTLTECLDEHVEWFNYTPVKGKNDIMPWIGTYHGRDEVLASFQKFVDLVQVNDEELVRLIVEGEEAAGVVHEISTVKANDCKFEIEFVQWLTVRNGKIVRWKSYTDPSSIIAALEGNGASQGARK